jgi:serine/threonine protein kinase
MPRTLADLKVGRQLGSGNYGRVFLVRERGGLRHFALKVLHKNYYRQIGATWADEVRLLWVARSCPYVLRLEDWFEDENCVYLLLELAQCDLYDVLPVAARDVRLLARQVLLALQACHQRGITHRDVKLENVLLLTTGEVRLADFGCASDQLCHWQVCGTQDYFCPRKVTLLSDYSSPYSRATDLWSFGVLLYELLTGALPFECETPALTYSRILSGKVSYPSSLSVEARDLLVGLLCHDEGKRLTVDQALSHPFFSSVPREKATVD